MTHPSDTKKSTPAHAAADVGLDERENRLADHLFMDVFEERQRRAFEEKLPKPNTQPDEKPNTQPDEAAFFLDDEDMTCLGLHRVDDGPFGDWDRKMRRQGWKDYIAQLPKPKAPSKPRTPAAEIKQIEEKTGKTVTGVTVAPDGTKTYTFTSSSETPSTGLTADEELD